MKQHVARVMMLLAAGCGAAVQRVEASYSDCLSANEGLLDAPAARRIPLWPAQRIGSERGRGGTGPVGAHAIVVPDLGDRYVTLDTSRIASWGGSRPVHWDLRYDGGATQRAGAVRHAPFELFGMTPFADGYGALSPCDSDSWRDRLDGVCFEMESAPVATAAEGPASLCAQSGSGRQTMSGASAMIFSSPGAVLLSAIGVALIGQQRRKTLF